MDTRSLIPAPGVDCQLTPGAVLYLCDQITYVNAGVNRAAVMKVNRISCEPHPLCVFLFFFSPPASSKHVQWLLGRDGDVSVIVIGEVDEFRSSKLLQSLRNNR